MDPEANIHDQVVTAQNIARTWDDCNADGTLTPSQALYAAEQANKLAELVIALHDWRTKGGFDPYTAMSEKQR
jgi:hypothetical protein